MTMAGMSQRYEMVKIPDLRATYRMAARYLVNAPPTSTLASLATYGVIPGPY